MAKRKAKVAKGADSEAPEAVVSINPRVASKLVGAWGAYFSDAGKGAALRSAIDDALRGAKLELPMPLPQKFLDETVRPLVVAQLKAAGRKGDSVKTMASVRVKFVKWSPALTAIPREDYAKLTADRDYLAMYLTRRNEDLPHKAAMAKATAQYRGTAAAAKKNKAGAGGSKKSFVTHAKSMLTLNTGKSFGKDAKLTAPQYKALLYVIFTEGLGIPMPDHAKFASVAETRRAAKLLGLS